MADLAKHGAASLDVRGVEFDPPPGSRGLQGNMKVTMWQATITHLSASRPMVRAVRANPDEATADAISRFLLMIAKKPGEFTDTISTPAGWTASARSKAKPKPKPAPVAEEDDDDD